MTSNTAKTSGNFRAVPLADQLVGVKPIKGPIEMALALRQIYSIHDKLEQELTEYKKQRHMNEINETGNDYEIQET